MLTAISTFVMGLIALGWVFRHRAKAHMALMGLAFLLDVGLLLYIEGTRHAIHTVEESLQTPWGHGLLLFHVSVSFVMLTLYIAQISSGILLYRTAAMGVRRFHVMSAILFLVCRLLNYVTSFFVVV